MKTGGVQSKGGECKKKKKTGVCDIRTVLKDLKELNLCMVWKEQRLGDLCNELKEKYA